MNSQDKQWWVAQAGEYVLGTLGDSESKAFKKAMQHDANAQRLVLEWEELLQPLADALKPVMPAPHVWVTIKNRISVDGFGQTLNHTTDHKEAPDGELSGADDLSSPIDTNIVHLDEQRALARSFEKRASRWRSLTGLATAASLVLATFAWFNYSKLRNQAPQTTLTSSAQFDAITLIRDEKALSLWVVDSKLSNGLIRVTAVAAPPIDNTKAYELWMVKPDNGGVVSMGLIPQNNDESVLLTIDPTTEKPEAFAVSLEFAGGSKEPGPSGPVLYQGLIQTLKL